MSNHPKLIQELINKNLEIGLKSDGYVLHGFYKHGSVCLIPLDETHDQYLVQGRYSELGCISTYYDLVDINYNEWVKYRERLGNIPPEEHYIEDMLKLGLIEPVTTYKPAK